MEIIPQEKVKTSRGLNILFYFSLIILFFSIVGFFTLNRILERTKEEQTVLDTALKKELPLEKAIMEREVLSAKKRIANFSFLIDQQVKTSRFFEAFEKIIHPQVWFSTFNLSPNEGMVALTGHAESFKVLEQQFFVIQNTEWIKNIDLGTVAITEDGKIDFGLSLFFNPKILK